MIWVAGRSPTLVSHSLRGVATNLKATTLAYLAILIAWLTEMLLPTIGAGKKIVLDNASFHRCKLVRKVVETAGCELIYLPKYSPDLNPIEHPWHRIKQRVRKPMTSTTQQSS
jgi:transposase